MEMPTPCERCGDLFDLLDGKSSPRNPSFGAGIIICEGCADKEQEEIDREEEIQELKDQVADAEYSLREAKTRLVELGVSSDDKRERHLTPCVAGTFGHSLMLKDGTKVCINRGEGAEAAHVWLTNPAAEVVTVQTND